MGKKINDTEKKMKCEKNMKGGSLGNLISTVPVASLVPGVGQPQTGCSPDEEPIRI